MLYIRKVLVVIKSGEKNKPIDQGGRGLWEERRKKNPAKINRGDDSPTRALGVETKKVKVNIFFCLPQMNTRFG